MSRVLGLWMVIIAGHMLLFASGQGTPDVAPDVAAAAEAPGAADTAADGEADDIMGELTAMR
jgi:hypothetical protein